MSIDEKKRKIRPWIIVLLLIFISAAGVSLYLFNYYTNSIFKPMAQGSEPKLMDVVINKGASTAAISEMLYNKGLIKDSRTFRLYVKFSKVGSNIKAGKYQLSTGMNAADILQKMVKGDVKRDTVKVTIPEGYEIKNIAETLEKAGLVKKDQFIEAAQKGTYDYEFLKGLPKRPVPLEGYLFPDTYEFTKDATPEEIIKKMLDRFNEVFDQDMIKKAASMNLSIDNIVTMASIVEREAKAPDERPIVAAVFYNRIKIHKNLESCATIQYALGERKERLYNKDLQIKSPYNTYKNPGLPIGPIANPGKASIEAALNPVNVDYLYFVVKDPDAGTHAFSKNYSDFLKDKEKYLQNLK